MIKLAWRNIWRNSRRTVITIASVFFAVFFCVITMSFQKGMWDRMIDNTLRTQTGHIQIHAKEYWEDKVIDNFMFMDSAAISELENIGNIANVSPGVETFAMAASDLVSRGIAIIGVSPEKEAQKSNLSSRIIRGEYLSETDDGILIGEGLANYLKVDIGDTLALIGQGYQGSNAAELFPIRGILKLMTTEMNNSMAYITLPAAQQFINMPDGYSGILISIKDNKRLNETIRKVNEIVDETHDVYSWHFTMERLLQQSKTDTAFGVVIIFVMYVIVGFGILGTVIMMTNERRREFCVMISLGMQRIRLSAIIAVELLIMSFIGVALAFMITLPIAYWFAVNPIELGGEMGVMMGDYGMEPIMPMSFKPSIFIEPMITIFVIVLLAIIYPVNRILKLRIVK